MFKSLIEPIALWRGFGCFHTATLGGGAAEELVFKGLLPIGSKVVPLGGDTLLDPKYEQQKGTTMEPVAMHFKGLLCTPALMSTRTSFLSM